MTTESSADDSQRTPHTLYTPPGLATRLADPSTSRSLQKELSLVNLYTAACLYQWDSLPSLAAHVHRHTGDAATATRLVQATIRHLVVFSGYGPTLAAMTALKRAVVDEADPVGIPFDTPGKVSVQSSGAPLPATESASKAGNAFELVYHELSPKVRGTVYQADPVLENWIQNHLYGDVYSSPGLGMLTKQHLTIAGLVKSNMQDQLYGHALAALRFGGDVEFLKAIVDVVTHWQQRVRAGDDETISRNGTKSKRVIDMAVVKFKKGGGTGATGEILAENPEGTVCVPAL